MTPWRAEPQTLAREILADPHYLGQPAGTSPRTIWDTIVAWLGERVHDILRAIGHALGAHGTQEKILGIVLIAAGAVALLYLLVRIIAWIASRTALQRYGPSGLPLNAATGAAQLRAQSRAAARRGAYREAARCLFLAALRALDETGRVAYDAALTPGDYRRAVRDPRFDSLARDATVALFATREPDAALVERMERAYDGFFASA
ncbi:MAG: hypothetical protein WCE44_02420 [Candidatus Velthaea sp.]